MKKERYDKVSKEWFEKGKLQALKKTKCSVCKDSLENTRLICWTCFCNMKDKVKIEHKKEELEFLKDLNNSKGIFTNISDRIKQLQKEIGGNGK